MGIYKSSLALKAKYKQAVIFLYHSGTKPIRCWTPLDIQGMHCLRTLKFLQKQATWQPDAEAHKTIWYRTITGLQAHHH